MTGESRSSSSQVDATSSGRRKNAPRAGSTATDGLPPPQRYWAALTLMIGITITVLDSTMSNVALPAIARDMQIDPAAVVWVVIAYNLIVVVGLLPLSALGERVGFRRMFAAGLSLFLLASIGSATAQNLWWLIGARMAQGLGSAMLMCLFGGLVRNIYPLRMLAMGISYNAMAVGLMSVLGPTLGAFILQVASWHWVFLVNMPLGLVAYFGLRFLPDVPRSKGRFDWFACLLSVPVFGLTIIGLDRLVTHTALAVLCLLLATLAGWALVRRSRDQTAPIFPVDLLRIPPIAYAVGASWFSFAAQMAAFVSLPFYFKQVLGYSYADVGLMLAAWSVGVAAMAPMAAFLSGRFSVAVLCGIGAGAMASGLAGVLLLPLTAHFVAYLIAMFIGGVGFGFFQTPNNRALLAGAPRSRSGAAGGMQATTRVFGQSFGTALVAVGFNLSATNGAAVGVMAGVLCALAAMVVNIKRYYSPMPDLEL